MDDRLSIASVASRTAHMRAQPPHPLVFALLIFGALLPAELVTALLLVLALRAAMSRGASIFKPIRTPLKLAAVLIAAGMVHASANDWYDVLKDSWYFSNYIVVLLVGSILGRRKTAPESVLIAFVWGGVALSVVHLSQVALGLMEIGFVWASVAQFRESAGAGYFASFLSLVLVLVMRNAGWGTQSLSGKVWFIQTINAVSILFSFSRVMWLALLITFFVTRGFASARSMGRLAVAVSVVAVLALAVPDGTFVDSESPLGSFAAKILSSAHEIAVSDQSTKEDINTYWRGYESFLALRTYLEGDSYQLLLGHGLGKLVELDVEMTLAGTDFWSIPVLHNGYLFVLVKTGAIGVMAYLLLLAGIFRRGVRAATSRDPRRVIIGRLVIAMVAILAMTTFVISGPFNKSVLFPILLLLGCMLGVLTASRVPSVGRQRLRFP